MASKVLSRDVFGFIKPLVDVHTMGIYTISNLLIDCGYHTIIANDEINEAVEHISKLNNYSLVKSWIKKNNINRLGFSYRLDPNDGCEFFMQLYERLLSDSMMIEDGGPLKEISFAGLPDTCELVTQRTGGKVLVFPGNETPFQSLSKYKVPKECLPINLTKKHEYDNVRWNFAKKIIASEKWKHILPLDHLGYNECGSENDSYIARLNYAKSKHSLPIIRTHSGPYNPNRQEALKEYNSWCKELAQSKLLDVLSIGSSQLTQAHFGENWEGLSNGGGVPVNSALEYQIIKDNAKPMLVRTYSGTKDVPRLAEIHEKSLNISWHALSFWWFDELDGRGKNSLLENLQEHFEAIKYIVSTGKPVEPNVPHHFAFRGADDVSYIISGFLAAKACKKLGVSHLILQNMLNTPKYTYGVQDLAKGRVMLKLVRSLEDSSFKVSLQTRAGLDYFATDLEEAKVQLAAVTCMMDDLEPGNDNSPEIIHVVNYCEAVQLATPSIIKESIQITLSALKEYRLARQQGYVPNMEYDKEAQERFDNLYTECLEAIALLEKNIPNLYSPEGFYKVFTEGFFPVPYLMDSQNKFKKATQYHTAIKNGGIKVVDSLGQEINTIERYKKIISNMDI